MPALELDAIEARIIGVLIEKESTTPDQYPLSLNALTSGCNQKSNRDPVLELSEAEISAALERLRRKSLVGASHAAGSRVERYRHAAQAVWSLSPGELAVMAELMLRGPQMPGELRARADRMSRFESLEALANTLESLRQRGFVQRLEPLPGARAPQWTQIVAAPMDSARAEPAPRRTPLSEGAMPIPRPSTPAVTPVAAPHPAGAPVAPAAPPPGDGAVPGATRGTPGDLERRVQALEAEVARLRSLVQASATTPPSP